MTNQVFKTSFAGKSVFIFLVFQLLISYSFGQSVYYIDPTYSGAQRNGTQTQPYNSFSDFNWEAGASYLLKSSTSIEATSTIVISANDVTLSSYGSGNRPVIHSKVVNGTRVMVVKGDNVTVKNLDVRALDNGPDNSAGCVIDMIGPHNPVLDNVKTTGGNRGINASQTTGRATIINCHITDTWDDGMYNRINDTVIIENTLVERVNLKYHINPDQTYAGGDCIQFDYITHFELRNSTLDKTYTGGKFCLIADHFETGITENSRLIGAQMQHGVYLGIGNHFIFRNNTLTGGQYGVWNKTVNTELYYNVFKNTGQAAYNGNSQASSKVWNNLFVSCAEAITGWNENMEIRNNIFYNNARNYNANFSKISASNNCYSPGQPGSGETSSISANPLFVNASGGDYRLSEGSPCIDAGFNISRLSADMQGNAVPSGSASDIGPNEYGSFTTAVNSPPVIDYQIPVSIDGGKVAVIDASSTRDADNDDLTFSWSSAEGIQLEGANSPVVQFLAPDTEVSGNISFTLKVSDGTEEVAKTINVAVQPYKPGVPKAQVSASEASTYQDPNVAGNAFDGNFATRWSAEGDGQWLSATLDNEVSVSHLKVAYHNGSYRKGYFDVYASKDNVNWTPLLQNASTCGFSEEYQVFEIPSGTGDSYRFLRIIGHANSENSWNSYSDIGIYGTVANQPPLISVSKSDVVPGAKVATIDASASSDPEGSNLTYSWTSLSGIHISSPDAPSIRFLAPDVTTRQTIRFELTVSDGVNSSSSTIDVDVEPYKPEIPQAVLIGAKASSFQDPNLPDNAIDGSYETRWSADGDNSWLVTELESVMTLSHFKIAYHNGNYRKGYFDVYASADNQSWDLLVQNGETSGVCDDCQAFDVPEDKQSSGYKYIKLVGHSNSENSWNSYSEFKVYGNETSSAPVVKVNAPASVPGARVASMDASASYDPDGSSLSYSWSSSNGIQLSSTTGSKVNFLAPDVSQKQNVEFDLTVSNGRETVTSTVSIVVEPYRPEVSRIGVIATEASAYQSSNVPGNAVDGDLSTRWSANGDNQYLVVELENPSSLAFFKIAYLNGHYRIGYFDILGSVDKNNWDMLLQNQSTSGLSEGFQAFEVPSTFSSAKYKYIKFVGHSNSENNWNSIIEMGTYGMADLTVVDDGSSETTGGGSSDAVTDLSSMQNIYYIDPTYAGSNRTGTIDNPFNSFSDFQWQPWSAYLIKSSTTISANSTINVSANNVILSSYGDGERPVINSQVVNGTRVMVVTGDYVKVSNLDVRAKNNGPDNSAGCVIDMIKPRNPVLENVKTTGGNRGINASQTTGTARIINCHITDTWDDGMYNRINDTVIIENTRVERVNLKYHINPDQTYAGGDCIQFDYVTHFELRNCTLDKTYTGGKFCLIADHFESGITEHSDLIGAERQHGVYLGIGNHFIFRYNNLSGCQYGVWNKTVNVELYYNIFKNTALAAYYGDSPASSKIWNNLFTSCGEGVLSWNETMEVKNNIFYSNSRDLNGNFGNIDAGYNCYYPGSPHSSELHSFSANPKFVDASGGNYQLDPLSPCIDAGTVISGINADLLNTSLPAGNTTDIGVYEYASSSYDSDKKSAAAGGITNIDAFASKDFSMYPNPSSGVVNLDFSANLNTNVSRIRIINMNGKVVYEKTFNDGTDKVSINHNFRDGVYVVHVTYDDAIQTTRKLIVSTP